MELLVRVLKSLSDKTRLRILAVLQQSRTALCICEVVDALALPQYAVSRHMKELRHAGLVREQRLGRFMFYSMTVENKQVSKIVSATLLAVDDAALARDRVRLKKRLSLRTDGDCVVGSGGCCG